MKKLIAALIITVSISVVALAGDIPGNTPAPPPSTTAQIMLSVLALLL